MNGLETLDLIIVANFFFFHDTATTEIYTLSLHDALPIFAGVAEGLALPLSTPASAVKDERVMHAVAATLYGPRPALEQVAIHPGAHKSALQRRHWRESTGSQPSPPGPAQGTTRRTRCARAS